MPDLLESLNLIQKQAVKATEGPSLILAGAGSGKTRVLTFRVAYLIEEKKIPPENILCITFTNKAANEMKQRILSLLQKPSSDNHSLPIMGTFHSLAAKILRKDGHLIGLPISFTIYDENDALDAIKEAMKGLGISPQKTSPGSIKSIISSAKNEMIGSLEYPQYARGYFQETVAKVYLEYQKILEKNHAADFDDLLLLTVKLFQLHPQILSKYHQAWRYILIDEYQDTNSVQYLLTKFLAKRFRNLCVVGDASQSIYRFRGADFRNIVNFNVDYPDAKIFNLEQNYRSTQNILDAAYSIIHKNKSHPVLKLWTDNPTGPKIGIAEVRDEVEEATFIVKKIHEINLPLSSFAILYRTNAQSRSLEEVFLKSKIPYVLIGGIRFYERKEIKDILSYLKLLINSDDSIAKLRIEKIGKIRAQKFYEWSQNYTSNTADYQTLELMDGVIETTNYLDYIDDGTEAGKSRIENVKELRSVAEQFPNLIEFLENVALVQSEYSNDEKKKDNPKDAITLMTLHQAKGLEWPVVFIVGMEEGLLPHSRTFLDPSELEEERRLCYVGITRAQKQLILTYARQRLFFGSRSNNLISRFIIEIPSELVENIIEYTDHEGYTPKKPRYRDEDDWINE